MQVASSKCFGHCLYPSHLGSTGDEWCGHLIRDSSACAPSPPELSLSPHCPSSHLQAPRQHHSTSPVPPSALSSLPPGASHRCCRHPHGGQGRLASTGVLRHDATGCHAAGPRCWQQRSVPAQPLGSLPPAHATLQPPHPHRPFFTPWLRARTHARGWGDRRRSASSPQSPLRPQAHPGPIHTCR